MGYWVCVKSALTSCGWVQPGRVVADGDPMLDGLEVGVFERIVLDGSPVEEFGRVDPPPPPVEEATAEPGRVRRTARRKAGL